MLETYSAACLPPYNCGFLKIYKIFLLIGSQRLLRRAETARSLRGRAALTGGCLPLLVTAANATPWLCRIAP